MNIYSIYQRLQPAFRAQRMRLFCDAMQPSPQTTILDVGGNHYDWNDLPLTPPITVLNVDDIPATWEMPAHFSYCVGDGRALPFADQSFDIVHANSVIEHLGHWADQQRFAAEMLRVGKRVFVQTPHRWFPIEPHFLTAFVHYLPKRLHRTLIPALSVRGWLRSGDNVELKSLLAELRLLSASEMRTLFPGCRLHRERLLGLTKSLIATRT